MSIPTLYPLVEAAPLLRISDDYLRSKLRDRTFAGVKIAGRWYMTEEQIEAAITSQSTEARPPAPVSPAGLSSRSRFRRRVHAGMAG